MPKLLDDANHAEELSPIDRASFLGGCETQDDLLTAAVDPSHLAGAPAASISASDGRLAEPCRLEARQAASGQVLPPPVEVAPKACANSQLATSAVRHRGHHPSLPVDD